MNKSQQVLQLLEADGYAVFLAKGDAEQARKDIEAILKEMLAQNVEFDPSLLDVQDTDKGLQFTYPDKFLDTKLFDGEKYKNISIVEGFDEAKKKKKKAKKSTSAPKQNCMCLPGSPFCVCPAGIISNPFVAFPRFGFPQYPYGMNGGWHHGHGHHDHDNPPPPPSEPPPSPPPAPESFSETNIMDYQKWQEKCKSKGATKFEEREMADGSVAIDAVKGKDTIVGIWTDKNGGFVYESLNKAKQVLNLLEKKEPKDPLKGKKFKIGDVEFQVKELATGYVNRQSKEPLYWVKVLKGDYSGYHRGDELNMTGRSIAKYLGKQK